MTLRPTTQPPPMGRLRATLTACVCVFAGFIVLLFTAAIGVGDTAIGNSGKPWILGDVVFLGTLVLVGAVCFRLVHRTGATRRRAGLAAVAVPCSMLAAIVLTIFAAAAWS